jgi:truncated hemoglobin YjbI
MTAAHTLFDQIGESRLRAVLADFYDRVFGDVMIGFMFEGKDKTRLVDKEYELIAALLGADVKYTGRPMRAAHAAHTIFGGHFERRMQLLRNVFADQVVPPEIAKAWLDHAESLRSQITRDKGSECSDTASTLRQAPAPTEGTIKLGRR